MAEALFNSILTDKALMGIKCFCISFHSTDLNPANNRFSVQQNKAHYTNVYKWHDNTFNIDVYIHMLVQSKKMFTSLLQHRPFQKWGQICYM